MSNLNYHAQTFTLDALDLDPIEKNIIKSTLRGLYGEDTHYTVWKLANAWSLCSCRTAHQTSQSTNT